MFGWFKPICPCDPAAKQWIETQLEWLTRQFGLHILLESPVIKPTSTYFPDEWDGSKESVLRLFHRVCQYMKVDEDAVQLQLFVDKTPLKRFTSDGFPNMAAGTWSGTEGPDPWQKGIIRLEQSILDRPSDLVGVMAHELSHQRLIGEGRANADAFDNELLTDLTAIFFGFGIFLANNPRKSTGELQRWPNSTLYRPEYMSEPMTAYALAHIAWFRDEDDPPWAKCLRWPPRAAFKQGLRFLQKTNDSRFKPVRFR
jgi:hypothetical protein